MSRDLLVFHSVKMLTDETVERIRSSLSEKYPEHEVIVCQPGDTVSMPMDTRHLCESIKMLKDMVAELIQANQELVSGLLSMAEEGGVEPSPYSHLGMSG